MAINKRIPEDLTMEVISKLPVKSVIRFKALNKTINSITNTHWFIAKHFSNSTILATRNQPTFLTIHLVDGTFVMTLVSKELDELQQPQIAQPLPPIDVTPILPLPENHVDTIVAHGPSNGIFCLEVTVTGFPNRLILWNPATRETNALPLPLDVEKTDWNYCHVVHGFSFDPNTTDYKVVRVFNGGNRQEKRNYAQVFSLREYSWRMIDINFPPCSLHRSMYSSLLNGTYHWLDKSGWFYSIICFDMENELFTTMNRPEDDESNEDWLLEDSNLAVIDDKLAYVEEYITGFPWETWADILVMTDYGVHQSWTKRFVIRTSSGSWMFWDSSN